MGWVGGGMDHFGCGGKNLMCKVKIRLTQPNWVGAGAELGNKLQCTIVNWAI